MKRFLLKNNKGAITLFVLISMLFFMVVLSSLFMTTSNQKQSQTSELDKIKQEYENSVDNIDQIYNNTLANQS